MRALRLAHHREAAAWALAAAMALGTLAAGPVAGAAQPIADPSVSRHVEREILLDPAVPYDMIDVVTTGGVVTLTGTVDNLLAKERATRVAQTVRGVRSVVNRIEVRPKPYRTAAGLKDAVRDALLYDPATDAYELWVTADDKGGVVLSGTVDSWQERDLSETVAKGVRGVTRISNDIVVKVPAVRQDVEIKNEVERRLHWDTLVDDALINVRVTDGTVALSGTVGSAAEKNRASWKAWVSGVKSVDSSGLEVAQWARDDSLRKDKYVQRSDPEMAAAVRDALLYDPRVNSFDLDVAVSAGKVSLQGVVDNMAAKNAAIRDAENTVGVIGVDSLIKVRPLSNLGDDEIAKKVREALLRNPYTESYEIDVRVDDQVVRLEGDVDSYFEKAEAENVAFRAPGVKRVQNYLDVRAPTPIGYDPYVYSWSIYQFPWYDGGTVAVTKTDRRIADDIRDEIFWSPFVDSDDVTVSVLDGVATLSGTVDSWGEYRLARENAFEGGAVTVVNKLDVKNHD